MLDINQLKQKAAGKAKTAAKGFISDRLPNMGGLDLGTTATGNGPVNLNWGGMPRDRFVGLYRDLYKLGIQHKSFYLVQFSAYRNNATRNLELVTNNLMPWLATELSVPLLQFDTDSKRMGHYNANHITGSQSPEITLTMIETKNNYVAHSLMQYAQLVCHVDGSYGLPAEYVMWMDLWLYNRDKGLAAPSFKSRYLVKATQASLELAASEGSALTIPITFSQARPFMPL
ncbi:hypothetical protein ACE5JW_11765 [Acinetobacter radioresistens]|jgi:hypothetical protein|uniref:hypothetical protein n=1 Tax=Acinetobacter TaxID=469 RepID=UPI0002CE0F7C|nr:MULTISPECIES: hypothetical protein [Acinetobacter]ENV88226.1 hypothetical protein F940_00072 [Acinetobacter radioresistens NIPH 2130]EXB84797.1 hypothetical protein J538_1873 [Acinetobacter sp. 272263]MCK4078636.1 hypothetical protein [Acinetobacter radioresistens]MCK4084926.1 hypothetical protein [Acinetobacter radioresistens]MCK4097318.1 hypothetical protein [Acinetobacter radioresistens]